MKITIQSKQRHLWIPVPNFLISSPAARWIIIKGIEQYPQLTVTDADVISLFLKEISEIMKKHKGLEIICVESSNGEVISIVL